MIPSWDHTRTPCIEFDGFLHLISSTTAGSALRMRARISASVSPLQSERPAMIWSISAEADPVLFMDLKLPEECTAAVDVAERAWHDRSVTKTHAEPHLRDLVLLRQARDRIDREYSQPLNVEEIARDVYMSAGHFSRQFKLAYGESPYSYLMTRRVERAMALVRGSEMSVTEVCFAVGFSSLGTFSTRFRELVGVPPSSYRRQAVGEMAGVPPCVVKQVTRPIRNREAVATIRT